MTTEPPNKTEAETRPAKQSHCHSQQHKPPTSQHHPHTIPGPPTTPSHTKQQPAEMKTPAKADTQPSNRHHSSRSTIPTDRPPNQKQHQSVHIHHHPTPSRPPRRNERKSGGLPHHLHLIGSQPKIGPIRSTKLPPAERSESFNKVLKSSREKRPLGKTLTPPRIYFWKELKKVVWTKSELREICYVQ